MLYLEYILKFIAIYSLVTSDICAALSDSDSVIGVIEALDEIRIQYAESTKKYTEERINEINTILGTASSRWDYIRDVSDLMIWASTDMNSRYDFIKSKLPSVLSNSDESKAVQELKETFRNSLTVAENFWHSEVDKSMKWLREHGQTIVGLIREPVFTTEHPWLNLTAEDQPIYEEQMRNLTNIASITKDIIRAYLEQVEPKLPEKHNVTYISYKTKHDRLISKIIMSTNLGIDSSRIFATERVSGNWRIQGRKGPTKEEFDKEYINLSKIATNIVKDISNTIKHYNLQ